MNMQQPTLLKLQPSVLRIITNIFFSLSGSFPFPTFLFTIPKSAGDISVVNYEGKNVFDFFVPFSSKKKRLFFKKYFWIKEAP